MKAVKTYVVQHKLPVAGLCFIVFFIVVALRFSFLQSLWVDESTQLSGLSLSVLDIYRWLGGMIENPFLVPADRMPPLGYFVGVLWSSVFGLDVLPMRLLSLVLVALGLLFLFVYFFRQQRLLLVLFALLLLCMSANLVVIAVEIRSYALFFLLSTVAAVLYFDILQQVISGNKVVLHQKIMVLCVVLALAMVTHFFGFLLCGSILGSYLLMSLFDKRFYFDVKILSVVSCILVIAIIIAFPSVCASIVISDGGSSVVSPVKGAVKLVYRLVAHQSLMAVIVFPAVIMVLVYGAIAWFLYKKINTTKVVFSLVLALGGGVAFAVGFLASGFDALAPHYNIWMLPFLAILFGLSMEDVLAWQQKAIGGVLLLVLGFGQYSMLVDGQKYAHTRFSEIQERVERYRQGARVGVLYNEPMAKTWFAGLYALPESVGQYIATNKGYIDLRTRDGVSQEQFEALHDIIVAAYGEDIYGAELARSPVEQPLEDDSPVYHQILPSSTEWDVIETASYLAQESADIVVYKKSL